jgi:hypothetical protein
MSQPNIDVFLSTTPTPAVTNILKRLGFLYFSLPFNHTEYWLILQWNSILQLGFVKIFGRQSIQFRKISKFISYPAARLLKPIFLARRDLMKFEQGEYSFSICEKCDESFSVLWENNKDSFSASLYRDAETLNWLYYSQVVNPRRVVIKCAHKDTQRLVGYLVFGLNTVLSKEIRVMQLKDIFMPRLDKNLLWGAIGFAVQWAEKFDVAAIRLWSANKKMDQLLAKLIRLKKKYQLPYYIKLRNYRNELADQCNYLGISPSPIEPDRGFS